MVNLLKKKNLLKRKSFLNRKNISINPTQMRNHLKEMKTIGKLNGNNIATHRYILSGFKGFILPNWWKRKLSKHLFSKNHPCCDFHSFNNIHFSSVFRLKYSNFPTDWVRYDMSELVFRTKNMDEEEYLEIMDICSKRLYSRLTIYKKFIQTMIHTKNMEAAMTAYNSNTVFGKISIAKTRFSASGAT